MVTKLNSVAAEDFERHWFDRVVQRSGTRRQVVELILAAGFVLFLVYRLKSYRWRQRMQTYDAEGLSAT
jgi:hypothetical protein